MNPTSRRRRPGMAVALAPALATLAAPLAAATLLTACAAGTPQYAGHPAAPGDAAVPPGVIGTELPPMPSVTGPPSVYVEYPDTLQRITASDSNFIFGTVGTGDATLIINGEFVDVNPNGSFLAWLPVPPRKAESDSASYLLIARRGAQVDTLRHWILLPPQPYEGEPGEAWIDPGSLEDYAIRWMLPDEELDITVRAAPHADVWLDAGAGEYRMTETQRAGIYRYTTRADAFYDVACAGETRAGCVQGETADSLQVGVRVELAGEILSGVLTVPLRILDPLALPVAELREPIEPAGGADGIVHARPAPFGTYRWLLPNGTRAVVDGRLGGRWRLRFAPHLEAWVDEDDMRLLPPGTTPPTTRVGDLRFEVRADRLTLSTGLAAAVPLQVLEPDPYTIDLTLFGVTGVTDRIAEGAGGRLIDRIEWEQLPGDRYYLRIRLEERVWGYRASWTRTAAGGAELRFDIRRPPVIDPDEPLRGRRIAIDPGHPGAGAYGPTGYYEGRANLAIGRILAEMVREAGGVPVLTRDDTLPIGLYERTELAIGEGAELFVSIHNNALPDGVRPFGREGTSTYHYHPHSHDLAVAVQRGMLASMGLRDLGVFWGDLAVTRVTWIPSILTEGAFMMMPSHEAALKKPEFQKRYARGILDGIAAFLRSVAREQSERGGESGGTADADAAGPAAPSGSSRSAARGSTSGR